MTPDGSVPENESLYACVAISLPWIIIFKISHQFQVLWDFFTKDIQSDPRLLSSIFKLNL